MSALIAKDGTCLWPPSTIGWSRFEAPALPNGRETHAQPREQRRMAPSDLRHFTPAGLEQLARILREGIRRAKAGAK